MLWFTRERITMAAEDGEAAPGGCVLLTAAEEALRAGLRDALLRRGLEVLSVPTTGDALVVGYAERCDAVIVCVDAVTVAIGDAVGLLRWLSHRRGRAVPAVALVPDERAPTVMAAITAGFDLVFGRLATPDQVAEAVVKLREKRAGGDATRRTSPPE